MENILNSKFLLEQLHQAEKFYENRDNYENRYFATLEFIIEKGIIKMTTIEKILNLVSECGQGDFPVEKHIGLAQGSIKNWRANKSKPSADALAKIADYFNVSVDYLLGRTDKSSSNFPSEEIILVPIIAKVAAGFDHNFAACDIEEYQEVPLSIINGYEKSNLFCFLVSGDSMFPKFLDGDRVLVHRQSSVDSGSVAIVCYDDFEEGTIKKVVYEPGCNYVDMIPYNPNYKPVRLQGADLESCRIIGKIIYLFRKID